jgi:D-threo-aldose 1-dehydrogenase
MKARRIGETGLEVTEIGFGAAGIGNLYRAVGDEAAREVLEFAWEAGIRFFDTAPYYGHGLSERRVGDFLRSRRGYVLATKVGRLLEPVDEADIPDHGYVSPLPFRPVFDYSHDGVLRSIEQSLARLGLNRIDMAWVHDIGALTHGSANPAHLDALLSGGLRALERLKAEGVIGAYGLGVNEVQVCLDVMARAPIDAILLAGRYTLLDRSAAEVLLPLCETTRTSIVIGGVFNSGILATGAGPEAVFDYQPASADILARVAAMETATTGRGVRLAAAALAFPLRHPAVASVLIGTAKRSSLERNLAMLGADIPDDLWAACDAQAIAR